MSTGNRGVGELLIALLFWLISVSLLLVFALLALGGAMDTDAGHRSYWILLSLAFLVMALGFNPLIWKLLRRAFHPALTSLLSVVLGIGLIVAAVMTPYGAYVSAFDTPTMRAAAAKGSPEARLSLAQRLLRDPDLPPTEALALLRRGGIEGDGSAQALLIVLTLGQSFEGRPPLQRKDPEACRLLAELESAPRFVGDEVNSDWRRIAVEESRYRGWRRAGEPGEPLRCERASLNPETNQFRFTNLSATIPARFDGIMDLKAVLACTVQADGSLADCSVTDETPKGRGVAAWALAESRHDRVEPTDIYGWPSAGREILITTTRE